MMPKLEIGKGYIHPSTNSCFIYVGVYEKSHGGISIKTPLAFTKSKTVTNNIWYSTFEFKLLT